MKILIKITKEVIERAMWCGTDGNPLSTNCAIALAVIDLFPDAAIGCPSFSLIDGHNSTLPNIALDFIAQFDALSETPEERLKLSPIEFEIEVPNEVIESIGINQVYKVLSESKSLEMVMN